MDEDYEEPENTEKQRKPRAKKVFDFLKPWATSQGISEFHSEPEVTNALWELADKGWDGSPSNGLSFIKHNTTKGMREPIVTTTYYSCRFETKAACPYRICTKTIDGCTKIYEGRFPHCDHLANSKHSRGVSSVIVAKAMHSPTSLQKAPSTLLKQAMSTHGFILSAEEQEKARRTLQRRKKRQVEDTLGGCAPDSFAGLSHVFESFLITPDSEGFDMHTVYLAGGEFKCEKVVLPQKKKKKKRSGKAKAKEAQEVTEFRIAGVLSTDNLLLNGYRQMCTGQDMTFAVDASYRYTYQGYPLLPIKVINFSQSAKAVGWALVSNDNADCHRFAFEMMKKGVESAVQRHYIDKQTDFDFREDNDLFPHDQKMEVWRYEPEGVLTLIKDSSQAATVAAEALWLPPEDKRTEDTPLLLDGSCCMHASLRWVDQNRGKFVHQHNVKAFCNDINYVVKVVPHTNVSELAKELFVHKWLQIEQAVATHWANSWMNANISRADVNQPIASPLMFGIPADNNALESSNRQDKDLLERNKAHSTLQLQQLAQRVIRPTSCADTRYHTKLMTVSKGSGGNVAPNNKKFFAMCQKIVEEETVYGKLFSDLTFSFKSPQNDIPAGSFLQVTNNGLNQCMDDPKFWQGVRNKEVPTLREYRDYFGPKAQKFRDMVNKGMEFILAEKDFRPDFDYLTKLMNMFTIMRPILSNGADYQGISIEHWVHCLNYSGIPTLQRDEIVALTEFEDCLLACTCRAYLHYGLCKHSFCYAFIRGIITGWPEGAKFVREGSRINQNS